MYPKQNCRQDSKTPMKLTSIILTSIKDRNHFPDAGEMVFFVDNSVETWKTRAIINKYKLVVDNDVILGINYKQMITS